jgi:diadenosine tetraphosphatase ApaH/serine/threonine PP2A family protein phosphatase
MTAIRIAVLSDVHGNLPALECVAADIRARGIGTVVNLGDHASGPLWPGETVRYLMDRDWLQIAGNQDRELVHQDPLEQGLSNRYARARLSPAGLDWLRSLPAHAEVGTGILAVHGTPVDDATYFLETIESGRIRLATPDEVQARLGRESFPVILCGHSHMPRTVALPSGGLIVNPGSVGLPAYADDLPEAHIVETGSPHARYAILEAAGDAWQVQAIALPYDHRKAAEQARRNDRPDWEIALSSGFMHPGTPHRRRR